MTYRKASALLPVLLLGLALVAPGAWGRTYIAYHDSTEGHSTAVVVTNLGEPETSVVLTAYDSAGEEILSTNVDLGSFTSEALFLEELLEETSGRTWGLLRAETEGRIALAIWIGAEGNWLAIENVSVQMTNARAYDYSGYWMTTNYANTSSRSTGLSLVNPYDAAVTGQIYIYDADGGAQLTLPFDLPPYSSAFVLLSDRLDVGSSIWGMIDISCELPVLLVTEYLSASGDLIDVDLVSTFYLIVQ